MPEGDVVRITAARLDVALAGKVLEVGELRWPRLPLADLGRRSVLATQPYGKHLLTRLDDGWTLRTHLRMDGRWRVLPRDRAQRATRSPRVRVVLAAEGWTCLGEDLGMVDLVRTDRESTLIGHLGPDILADDLRASGGLDRILTSMRATPQRPVAEVLIDQRVLAGVGTLFMAEGLHREGIWPWTPVGAVADLPRLLAVVRDLMQRSVAAGLLRSPRVHARTGEPCRTCGTPVVEGVTGTAPQQRPVFFCRVCQAART